MEQLVRNQSSSVLAMTSANLKRTESGMEATIYSDAPATDSERETALLMVFSAYPTLFQKMTDEEVTCFKMTFLSAVKYAGMTGQQLRDAVMNCICQKKQYGQFQISDIATYNRSFNLHSYKETCGVGMAPVKIDGDIWWVRPEDLARLGYKVVKMQIVKAR